MNHLTWTSLPDELWQIGVNKIEQMATKWSKFWAKGARRSEIKSGP